MTRPDPREDVYTLAALLSELDRVLHPLLRGARGRVRSAPSFPPPLPTLGGPTGPLQGPIMRGATRGEPPGRARADGAPSARADEPRAPRAERTQRSPPRSPASEASAARGTENADSARAAGAGLPDPGRVTPSAAAQTPPVESAAVDRRLDAHRRGNDDTQRDDTRRDHAEHAGAEHAGAEHPGGTPRQIPPGAAFAEHGDRAPRDREIITATLVARRLPPPERAAIPTPARLPPSPLATASATRLQANAVSRPAAITFATTTSSNAEPRAPRLRSVEATTSQEHDPIARPASTIPRQQNNIEPPQPAMPPIARGPTGNQAVRDGEPSRPLEHPPELLLVPLPIDAPREATEQRSSPHRLQSPSTTDATPLDPPESEGDAEPLDRANPTRANPTRATSRPRPGRRGPDWALTSAESRRLELKLRAAYLDRALDRNR
jgi:hypothetical protein